MEKLAEIGVAALLARRPGTARAKSPSAVKVVPVVGDGRPGTVQRRMADEVATDLSPSATWTGLAVACHPAGDNESRIEADHVVIGPEGGWAPGEIARGRRIVGSRPTMLRVETRRGGRSLPSLRLPGTGRDDVLASRHGLTGEQSLVDKFSASLGVRLAGGTPPAWLVLGEVESYTDGEFKASVVGAYERGERAHQRPAARPVSPRSIGAPARRPISRSGSPDGSC